MTETERARLAMPLGEAIYTQRSIRRLRPDPIAIEDIRTIIEAASKAPSGGNAQPARYLVLTDPDVIRRFGALYREAWWAKRRAEGRPWTRREEIPAEERVSRGAAQLADEIADAPCIVRALTEGKGQASSVLPVYWLPGSSTASQPRCPHLSLAPGCIARPARGAPHAGMASLGTHCARALACSGTRLSRVWSPPPPRSAGGCRRASRPTRRR